MSQELISSLFATVDHHFGFGVLSFRVQDVILSEVHNQQADTLKP